MGNKFLITIQTTFNEADFSSLAHFLLLLLRLEPTLAMESKLNKYDANSFSDHSLNDHKIIFSPHKAFLSMFFYQ